MSSSRAISAALIALLVSKDSIRSRNGWAVARSEEICSSAMITTKGSLGSKWDQLTTPLVVLSNVYWGVCCRARSSSARVGTCDLRHEAESALLTLGLPGFDGHLMAGRLVSREGGCHGRI